MKQAPTQTLVEYIEELNKLIAMSSYDEEQSAKVILDKLSNSLSDLKFQEQVISLRLKFPNHTSKQTLEVVKHKLQFSLTKEAIVKMTQENNAVPNVTP